MESTIFPVTSCVCALAIDARIRHASVADKNFLILLIGLTAVEVRRQFLAGGGGLPNEDVGYPKGRFFGMGGREEGWDLGRLLEPGEGFFGFETGFFGFLGDRIVGVFGWFRGFRRWVGVIVSLAGVVCWRGGVTGDCLGVFLNFF
ncbi:hypothetical protein ACQ86N_33980 [Puia sp. P3]|uniref:hypothetical protein n=1 Tax=Puia sp. P3 TaxID=3423952 RepID=UPI003D66E438